MWKYIKKFLSLSYLCHRLLEQFQMHPSPLGTSSPKLIASRNNYFFKSLFIDSVIWVRDHFWVFLQTVSNTPQPSLTYRLYNLTHRRLISNKTIRLSTTWDAENSLEHDDIFLDIQKFSMWLRRMGGKALRVPLKTWLLAPDALKRVWVLKV